MSMMSEVKIRLAWLLSSGLLWGAGSGCQTLAYQAKENMVETLGVAETKQRLAVALRRAKEPMGIDGVRVGDDGLEFTGAMKTSMAPPIVAHDVFRLVYQDIDRFEIYENFYVFLWTKGNETVHKLLFVNYAEASEFVDLFWSLRARKAGAKAAATSSRAAGSPGS
jgi:hypothetical protein